jgi:hypothetical protein
MNYAEFDQRLQEAENGDTNAMFEVGKAYMQGQGVLENKNKAVYWMRKAIVGGNLEAKEEMEDAFNEYRKGAEQGDPDSMAGLIFFYLWGLSGEEDFKQAEYWAKKLNANIKYKLGAKAILMIVGVLLPANNFRELMEGAQKGNPNYQYGLGFAYLKGFGTDINPQQAVFWFQKAVEQGHSGAKQTLNQVASMITLAGNNLDRLNFDQIIPMMKFEETGAGAISKKHPLLWGIIVAAAVSYLATGLDIGWLYSLAIIGNVGLIFSLAFSIVVFIIRIIGRKNAKRILWISILLFLLGISGIISVICFSVHYIKGRKTENPVSFVLQNPFEAARKHFFTGKNSSE